MIFLENETMLISPKPETVEASYIRDYEKTYQESIKNPEAFWEKIAKELSWLKPWDKVLDWQYPYAKWFVGGQTNIVYNALDRFMNTDVKNKTALIWVAQTGEERKFTYEQLNEEVSKFANGLKSLGVKKGDKITIYLPRIPEQFIAMLACLKIGAVHSVVYSGFSADALKNRVEDAQAKIVICANSYPYGKKIIESKKNVDEALKENKTVEHVIVVRRLEEGAKIPVLSNRQGPLGGVAAKNAVSSFEDFIYFTGDSAKIDEDGYYWIVGRNDDVIKVSGHRLGSAELESAFVSNNKVAEAAVIGKPHQIKGESIKAFVILKQGIVPSDELKAELVQTVRKSIGPIATPDEIDFVEKLPKTRSGKIMRRVLKAQELGLPVGDTSTLDD